MSKIKLQVKEVTEKTGKKNADGSNELRVIGTLLGESVEGKIDAILDCGGRKFLESIADGQLLHHQYTSAFKSAATKNNPAVGLERLPEVAEVSRQLYREIFDPEVFELPEGLDPADFEDTWVVRPNWGFVPGESAAAKAEVKSAAEKAQRYHDGVEAQLSMLKDVLGVEVLTDEQVASAKKVVRKAVYGN